MDKRKIKIEDLYSIKVLSDPQISPDGKWVIFCVKKINKKKNRYYSHLFMGKLETQTVCQLTYGNVLDSQPRWSPDGKCVAFLRKKQHTTQLWHIHRDGREAKELTSMKEGSFGQFEWSPDGRWILFEYRPKHPDWTATAIKDREVRGLSNPPRVIDRLDYRREGEGFRDYRQHLWIFEVDSLNAFQFTEGDYDCRDPIWSPDGKLIAYIANKDKHPESKPFKQDIWIYDLEIKTHRRLPTHDGYKRWLSWSPKGDNIAYIGTETRDDPWCAYNDRVWIVRMDDGLTSELTRALDRIAENITLSDVRGKGNQKPIWSTDGKHILFLASDRGSSHLYKVDLSGNYQQLTEGSVDISGFSIDQQNQKAVILMSSATKPGNVYIYEGDMNSRVELAPTFVDLNKPLLDRKIIPDPEEIKIISEKNLVIQGWLLKPVNFNQKQKYPLILYVHGGPAAQYGNTFFHEFQVLAGAGYIVLYTNPRGSLGRETEFATSIQGNWGDLDYKDLMAAVNFSEKLPYVDNKKMAVVGGSYGGFMATWIIGNSNRFQCAITERGISNRHSAVGCNDYPPMPDGYWPGNPWNKPEALWQQSPLRFAESIDTPLLIIHSEGDLRCPISQAEQLFSALKKLGKQVVFLRYPRETDHGLSREGPPDLRIDRLHRIVNWLDKHLKYGGLDD